LTLRTRLALAALAATAALPLAAPPAAAALPEAHLSVSGKQCKLIGFTPGTDDVAANIRARNIGCRKVRRAIRRLHARDIAPAGFDCRHREHPSRLSHTDYLCTRDGQRFSWGKY
jgi:hypothetical protein